MRTSVVTVAYESGPALTRLLESLAGEADEVIVVNTGPPAPEVEAAAASARVVEAGANLGYAGGGNLGAREATGDVLVFLNPDTVVRPGAVAALAATASQPDVGIAMARLPAARPARHAQLRRQRPARERHGVGRWLRRAGRVGGRGARRRLPERRGDGDPPRALPRAGRLRRRAVHVPGASSWPGACDCAGCGWSSTRPRTSCTSTSSGATRASSTTSSGTGCSSCSPRTRGDCSCWRRRSLRPARSAPRAGRPRGLGAREGRRLALARPARGLGAHAADGRRRRCAASATASWRDVADRARIDPAPGVLGPRRLLWPESSHNRTPS